MLTLVSVTGCTATRDTFDGGRDKNAQFREICFDWSSPPGFEQESDIAETGNDPYYQSLLRRAEELQPETPLQKSIVTKLAQFSRSDDTSDPVFVELVDSLAEDCRAITDLVVQDLQDR